MMLTALLTREVLVTFRLRVSGPKHVCSQLNKEAVSHKI